MGKLERQGREQLGCSCGCSCFSGSCDHCRGRPEPGAGHALASKFWDEGPVKEEVERLVRSEVFPAVLEFPLMLQSGGQ